MVDLRRYSISEAVNLQKCPFSLRYPKHKLQKNLFFFAHRFDFRSTNRITASISEVEKFKDYPRFGFTKVGFSSFHSPVGAFVGATSSFPSQSEIAHHVIA